MIEYRISPPEKMLRLFLAAAFSIGGLAAIIAGFHGTGSGSALPVAILAIVLIPAGIFIYLETTRLCLTIDEQSMTVTHAFSSRSILLDEIAGFRSGQKNGILLDLKSGDKPLQVPGTLEGQKELLEWLQQRYTDIDAERLKEVTDSVLEDENLGLTREIRERRLKIARQLMVYGSFAVPFFIILIFAAPAYYKGTILLLLALPWIAVGLTWYFKGILRLYSSKSKPYPSLFIMVLFSEFISLFAITRNFKIYDYGRPFWISLLALSVLVLLVWAVACKAAMAGEQNRPAVLLCLFLVAAAHSYGLLIFSNCGYDRSTPQISRVEVSSKYKTRGKSTSYHLNVSPWGRFTEGENVQVPSTFYYSVRQGDSVSVYLGAGKWGIPWYEVRKD
jgi:hypothetical protein